MEQVIYNVAEAAALLRIPVMEVKQILERVLLHVKGDEWEMIYWVTWAVHFYAKVCSNSVSLCLMD